VHNRHYYLSLSQSALAQLDHENSIIRLVEIMDDVYTFVEEAEPMKKIESLGQIIEHMARQTTECAYFIRDYATNKNFCMSCTLHGKGSHHLHFQGNEP
jgi:hypothetical protein